MFDAQREFLSLANAASAIASSPAEWETKYDLIFSDAISGRIRDLGMAPDYYDPDTSYEEDVMAYVAAHKTKADQMRLALGQLISLPVDGDCDGADR